jgi:sec-independent protein translocase protein TatA
MLQNLSSLDLLIIFLVVLVLFGTKKIPQLVRGVAESVKEFKSAVKEEPTEE